MVTGPTRLELDTMESNRLMLVVATFSLAVIGFVGIVPEASAGNCYVNVAGSTCTGNCEVNVYYSNCTATGYCDVNVSGNCSAQCWVNAFGTCNAAGSCPANIFATCSILP
jgi:hypothetical protein